jgi:hypothetical protein
MSFALILIDFFGVGTGMSSLILSSDDVDISALAPYLTIVCCQTVCVCFMTCIFPDVSL